MSTPARGSAGARWQKIVCMARDAWARQALLHDRYLDSFSVSGRQAQEALTGRSREERDLESLFNAPAMSARRRRPIRPHHDE